MTENRTNTRAENDADAHARTTEVERCPWCGATDGGHSEVCEGFNVNDPIRAMKTAQPSTEMERSAIPPWPEGHPPPKGAPKAVDVIEDVLQEAFKGTTDVDLRLLAADVVDALQGDELRVELRWFDETDDDYLGAGVYVLTDGHSMSLRMRVWSSLVHHVQSMERALWLPAQYGESEG